MQRINFVVHIMIAYVYKGLTSRIHREMDIIMDIKQWHMTNFKY